MLARPRLWIRGSVQKVIAPKTALTKKKKNGVADGANDSPYSNTMIQSFKKNANVKNAAAGIRDKEVIFHNIFFTSGYLFSASRVDN